MSERPLSEWLDEGKRFTEEDAVLIALDVTADLDRKHGEAPVSHTALRLDTIRWSADDRRARLATDVGLVCRGFREDARELGETLVALLGGEIPGTRKTLPLSPAFRAVLDRMLAESDGARPKSPAVLRAELAGALAGAMPFRMLWGSRRLHGWLVACLSALVLSWSFYRSWMGPNRVLSVKASARHLAFSPDGKLLAASLPNTVHVWETATWTRRVFALPDVPGRHFYRGGPIAFAPDSRTLAVGRAGSYGAEEADPNGEVFVWDLATSNFSGMFRLRAVPRWLSFSPDGAQLAICAILPLNKDGSTPGDLSVWDVQTAQLQYSFGGGSDKFPWAAWSPDGKRLWYRVDEWEGGRYAHSVFAVRQARPDAPERRITSQPYPGPEQVAVNPDGRTFVLAETGVEVFRVIDEKANELRKLNNEVYGGDTFYQAFTPGVFSPDGRLYAAPFTPGKRASQRRVRVWDTASWRLKRERPVRSWWLKNPGIWSLSMSRRWLAAAFGNDRKTEIHLWSIAR